MPLRRSWAAAVASIALAPALAAPVADAAPAPAPNVVVVMTDDQRADDMDAMPKTRRLLGAHGTTFLNAFVSYPLCCPSRTTFLTGQYSHNHGITWNFEPFGGYERFAMLGQHNTLPVWLQRAGYKTGLIGKYLNEYGERRPTEIPPGWDDWQASVDPTTYLYYGFLMNNNGRLVRYGTAAQDYMTDVYSGLATRFIRRNAPARKPFFLWVTPNAPHTQTSTGRAEGTPAVPAQRHAERFATASMPLSASFGEEDMSDKPEILRGFAPIDDERRATALAHWRGRHGSLLAVDDMVERIVDQLRRSGELDSTVILFTSDNGWLLGEHRIVGQKYFGFEESIRVPLIARGPGFPRGRTSRAMALNVDLAPTIARTAGARMGRRADGIALQGPAGARGAPERDMLVETGPNSLNLPYYQQIHTQRWVLEEVTTGERELYDLRTDPAQLSSVAGQPAYARVEAALHARLERLRTCAGSRCHRAATSPEPAG
ncbi:MAG TPA: sulfatase [Solirubrobacteraceae bacterium]|nr:sulfatase [Solirubrobacteraceae bacterium]